MATARGRVADLVPARTGQPVRVRGAGSVRRASTTKPATLVGLMARLGHSTAAAAMTYQHVAADRDRVIAEALSKLVVDAEAESRGRRRAQRRVSQPQPRPGMAKRRKPSTLIWLV